MSQTQAIPPDMTAITPHLTCRNAAAAIDFYKQAFGAVEGGRLPGPDGRLAHAQIRIGGACVMLVDEYVEQGMLSPLSLNGSPVTIHLYVADVDATVAQAVAAGARVTMPVTDMFWGDRYGRLLDPFGHQWSVATHQRDVAPAEMAAAMQGGCPESAPVEPGTGKVVLSPEATPPASCGERNPVGWFEIYVQDMARAKAFYGAVFDVPFTRLESPIELWAFPMQPNALGAAGALAKIEGCGSGDNSVIVYFTCDDCGARAARAIEAGGQIHKAKMSIGQYGYIALVIDSEGNMIGLHSMH